MCTDVMSGPNLTEMCHHSNKFEKNTCKTESCRISKNPMQLQRSRLFNWLAEFYNFQSSTKKTTVCGILNFLRKHIVVVLFFRTGLYTFASSKYKHLRKLTLAYLKSLKHCSIQIHSVLLCQMIFHTPISTRHTHTRAGARARTHTL